MFSAQMTIAGFDPELAKAIAGEQQRQEDHIELIASENYTSPRVLEAQGSVLTNKYAEGYPGARYYGGCEYIDIAEQLAIDRELLGDIDVLAAAVVARPGIALGVLVREHTSLALEDRVGDEVLRRDQLQGVL